MIPFKLLPGTVYTDTDSIFTTEILPKSLIGNELGMMKDELNGIVISEAFFLGIKKYGFYYFDLNNNKIETSVFSGVERNSLSFNEVKHIFNGSTIVKNIPVRFYKSLSNLSIKIDSSKISIQKSDFKKLINNKYIP